MIVPQITENKMAKICIFLFSDKKKIIYRPLSPTYQTTQPFPEASKISNL